MYCPVLSIILEYLTKLNKLTCTIMTIRNIYAQHTNRCVLARLCLANHPHCIYIHISTHTQCCKVKHTINVGSGVCYYCITVLWTFPFDFGTTTLPEHHSIGWFTFSITLSCNILCNSVYEFHMQLCLLSNK